MSRTTKTFSMTLAILIFPRRLHNRYERDTWTTRSSGSLDFIECYQGILKGATIRFHIQWSVSRSPNWQRFEFASALTN